MDKIILSSEKREEKGKKVNKKRKQGLVPSVVYGKGINSEMLWIKALELRKLLDKFGESVIIDLKIDDKDERNVIIHEIQKNPLSGKYLHVDFYQVNMKEKIEAEIELIITNEAPAVKELGGVLVKSLDKIKVKCLPADLPSHIDVDVSILKTFEDHVYVKDLKISEKVEVEIDPETVVALVAPPRSEEELKGLEEKVEEDVNKVEGVVKETPVEEGAEKTEEKTEENKSA